MSNTESQQTLLQVDTATDRQDQIKSPRPTWPPPARPRKQRSIPNLISSLVAIILCVFLVLSALVLLLFDTTTHYRTSLKHLATVEVQQTRSVQTTAQAKVQGTAQYFQNAQAQIEATATAQGNQAAVATQIATDATATATASENLYQTWTTGKVAIDDPMADNSGTSKWDSGSRDANTGCAFTGNAYHASEAQIAYLQPCIGQATNASELAYQADVTILKGNQGQAGLLFRVDSTNSAYYFFHVGSDGTYALDLYNLYNGATTSSTLLQGSSPTINSGFNQMNQLMVLADQDHLTILANDHFLGTVVDNSLRSGKIGVAVIDNGTPVDAAFTNVKVWKYEQR